ncbi:hypothetical protein [Microbulbifer sp. 2205BS26-8]|uniref:hypothetical protein n=1 Tax=Microbulbifer sp. 2205BS26-8 TaxID=3064386 RepID=UPI00273DEF14|nr:hypothetical protein [Microbulbifer sp. 2205BS26-8]MDP5211183.1 hypothetical protein [Microbulbifer sp. 2205BS26-8]
MKELISLLSQENIEKVEQLAKKNGKAAEDFTGELLVREIKKRNKPGVPKGNIRAFRRP